MHVCVCVWGYWVRSLLPVSFILHSLLFRFCSSFPKNVSVNYFNYFGIKGITTLPPPCVIDFFNIPLIVVLSLRFFCWL